MTRLVIVIVSVSVLALLSVFGALGCDKPAPQETASLRFYGEGEEGPGDGVYGYAMAASNTTAIRGRVLIEGQPIADFPSSRWPADYPPLVDGSILIVYEEFDPPLRQWTYSQPGEVWELEVGEKLLATGEVHVSYFTPGYVAAKFESVPVEKGKVSILPDVTLLPLEQRWIFYIGS